MPYRHYLEQYVMPTVKIFQGQLEKHKDLPACKLLMTIEQRILDMERQFDNHNGNKIKVVSENSEAIFNFINFPLANAFLRNEDKSKEHQSSFINKFYTTLLLDDQVRDIVQQ